MAGASCVRHSGGLLSKWITHHLHSMPVQCANVAPCRCVNKPKPKFPDRKCLVPYVQRRRRRRTVGVIFHDFRGVGVVGPTRTIARIMMGPEPAAPIDSRECDAPSFCGGVPFPNLFAERDRLLGEGMLLSSADARRDRNVVLIVDKPALHLSWCD